MADITFIVHRDWLEDLSGLPIDKQDKIIADFIRAGCEMPLAHSEDSDIEAHVKRTMRSIDASKKKYEEKIAMSKTAGRKKKLDDDQILRLAKEGYSSKEIADILGCSKSAIDHSDGWRARKQ